jgi:lipid A 3-O-deacylase
MKRMLLSSALALAAGFVATPASAHVEEIRLGVVHHNIRTDHGDLADPKEDGPNVEGELVFSTPGFLEFIGHPRPYAMVSYNTAGNTSFGGVGVYWRIALGDKWAFEPGFGYVIHDGELDIPDTFAPDGPEATAFEAEHQLLGSRDLFRTSFALEREVGDRFAWQIYYEHLSHGQILDTGRNQGLDEAGLRVIFRLDPDAAD